MPWVKYTFQPPLAFQSSRHNGIETQLPSLQREPRVGAFGRFVQRCLFFVLLNFDLQRRRGSFNMPQYMPQYMPGIQ
jgi:hypothetical protein